MNICMNTRAGSTRNATHHATALLFAVLAAGLLAGCGGGGDEADADDNRASTIPVNCKADPLRCP